MRITLQITSGPESSRKLWLVEGQAIVVGRTEAAELVVPDDPRMSGAHFSVAWVDGEFRIRDLESTNGTCLNGVKVSDAPLEDGDEITAGHTRFAVQMESADAARPDDLAASSSVDPTTDAVRDGTGPNGLSLPADGEEEVAAGSWCPADTGASSTPLISATLKTRPAGRSGTGP
ncbi:MAG: FHA domain-containing protein, partial [Planctomycetes bacterium]|nr:FHA domain-containing protein [Planctomycetota bacterium]